MNRSTDPEYLKFVRGATRILRKPLTGIVSGYHKLPYILIGPDREDGNSSIEVRGRIHVSPRLVITPNPDHPSFGQMFETEIMDQKLSARVFSFLFSPRYGNLKVQHEDLKINRFADDPPAKENMVLDELMRNEVIDTAVIGCPNIQFYPISLERFIQDILEREFNF